MLIIGSRKIERVHIVDDEPDARGAIRELIEDMGLEACEVSNLWGEKLSRFIESIPRTDAILCDLQLSKHRFAQCNGDRIVSLGVYAGIPGALCTSQSKLSVRRDFLRHIPVRIASDEMTADSLTHAWTQSVQEIAGEMAPSRRPWRTLVRVDSVDLERNCTYVVVPAWSVRRTVKIYQESLPDNIVNLVQPGRRFHAMVNTGARDCGDLFFVDWEEQ